MNILKVPREAAVPRKFLAKMNLTLDCSMIKATMGTVNFAACSNNRPHFTKNNQGLKRSKPIRKSSIILRSRKNAHHFVAPASVQSCVAKFPLRTVWMKILEMKTTRTALLTQFLVSALSIIAGISPLHRLEFGLFS